MELAFNCLCVMNNNIGEFIKNRRKEIKEETITDKIRKLPWYRRPLERNEFTSRKGKDGNFYVQHVEWHKTIFIGPYKTVNEAEDIIDSYLSESQKIHLDKKLDSRVHSIQIEDYANFF